ncbi:ribonuclease E activity regulator RraA [Marinicella litoralis]|uniref:4-hydroxy-4-methyl-2-oxoglutarate aldolase n=1 Tax=Marinicella litoralis TaxID=644220 RepID=A0A4R6XX15_9GAMM|nr:ribonuclease E activity regulator RraA [Marinicella litoralis]TDR22717.1 regulator of ribonuclease activity A [Marinicella litoralis]
MEKTSTPDLCDIHADQLKVLTPVFNSYGGRSNFFGQVVTVKCHEDNSLVKQQAATPGKGRVLVVDGGGSMRRALLGDMIAENAVKMGWSGFVIYGCIRDCDEIAALDLGVKALNTIPVKTEKRGLGDLNVPITFAGQTIHPGDWIYCDNNGIVVAKRKL